MRFTTLLLAFLPAILAATLPSTDQSTDELLDSLPDSVTIVPLPPHSNTVTIITLPTQHTSTSSTYKHHTTSSSTYEHHHHHHHTTTSTSTSTPQWYTYTTKKYTTSTTTPQYPTSTTTTSPYPTSTSTWSPSSSSPLPPPLPPSGVTIKGITYAGSGCSAGSVAGVLSSDAETLTLLYDSFVAQSGSGISPAEGRKNCQLLVDLELPQGWQFSILKADYRGYAFIEEGDTGIVKATYYFSGETDQVSANLTLNGSFDDNYLKTDEFGIESTVWSPCGEEGLLNIDSEVRLSSLGSNRTGLITGDSTDLQFTQVHYLQWEQC